MTQDYNPQGKNSHVTPPGPERSEASHNKKKNSLLFWLLVGCLGFGAYAAFSGNHDSRPPPQSQGTNIPTTPSATIAVSQNLVPTNATSAAIAASGYTQEQQTQIAAAIEKKEAQLVIMPIFDATGTGGTVNVTCGPWSKVITLTPKPTPLILPIVKNGIVQISPIASTSHAISAGIITVFGPQPLPTLYANTDLLSLTVSAQ